MFNLTGYEMVHQAERCCAHGGLIMYIHNELEHTVFSEIDISTIREHLTFIKMMLKKLGHLSKRLYNRKKGRSFP